jgi:hypothetical protein
MAPIHVFQDDDERRNYERSFRSDEERQEFEAKYGAPVRPFSEPENLPIDLWAKGGHGSTSWSRRGTCQNLRISLARIDELFLRGYWRVDAVLCRLLHLITSHVAICTVFSGKILSVLHRAPHSIHTPISPFSLGFKTNAYSAEIPWIHILGVYNGGLISLC